MNSGKSLIKQLPDLKLSSESDINPSELWLRMTAFLSQKAINTQRTYKGIIEEWCAFLGVLAGTSDGALSIIKARDIDALAYRNWLERQIGQKPRFSRSAKNNNQSLDSQILKERIRLQKRDGLQITLANGTIRKKIAALRRIYRMLIACGLVRGLNPFDTDSIPPPSATAGQKRPTEMLAFELVPKLLALPDITKPKGIRDRALLAILFGGGLRRSEAVSIRIGDLRKTSSGTHFLHLRSTKAKRDADQALPNWAASYTNELLELRLKEGAKNGDYLFISYRGRGGNIPTLHPISDSGLYKLFKSYCATLGVERVLSPHSARATAITKLLDEGLGHREVQEFSRHSSVQMVETYDKRRIGIDQNPAKLLEYGKDLNNAKLKS